MKFEFNLLPKEIFQKRILLREKIDKTSVLSALLPLSAVVVWIVFMTITVFISTDIKTKEKGIAILNQEISTYDQVKEDKSLLVLKTGVLEEIVKRDVNPEDFFLVVKKLVENSGFDAQILAYGRNADGRFGLEMSVDSVDTMTKIVRLFRKNERINLVELESVDFTVDSDARYTYEITFELLPSEFVNI